MNKCIIVLGCYRSGTSGIAGLLHQSGVSMGEHFDPPAHSNPKGYFEDIEFKKIFRLMAEGRVLDPQLRRLVQRREAQDSLWGLKDPELCIYLDRFADKLSVEHRLISTYRPFCDICASLSKALQSEDLALFAPLVDHYLKRKEEQLARYRGEVLEVNFKELMEEPRNTYLKICKFVDISFDDNVSNFIDRSEKLVNQ